MSRPLFSVVVPTYGRPKYVNDAVASVLGQSVDDFECIVVDDASPEPISVPPDPRVRIVRRDANGGAAAARNTGVEHAVGRYVTFLDDDDWYLPERLAHAVEGLERAPLALCWARFSDVQTAGGRRLEGDVSGTIRDNVTPHLGTTAVERSRFVPFDERFLASMDVEWWLRMAQREPVATVPRVGYVIRRHSGPRHLNDRHGRLHHLEMIADVHRDYFATHPRGAAFHWKRIGLTAIRAGEYRTARSALQRSFRLRPEPRTLWHVGRAQTLQVRSRFARAGVGRPPTTS